MQLKEFCFAKQLISQIVFAFEVAVSVIFEEKNIFKSHLVQSVMIGNKNIVKLLTITLGSKEK